MWCLFTVACLLQADGPPEPTVVERVPDLDGDGYGDRDAGGSDCDDGDAEVHPGVEEICGNGLDDDCDGLMDGCGLDGDVALSAADAHFTTLEDANGGCTEDCFSLAMGEGLFGGVQGSVAVAAPRHDGSVGAVFLYPWPGSSQASPYASVEGGEANGYFGRSLAVADATGDGQTDLVVGALYENDGLPNSGTVRVFSGPVDGGDMELGSAEAFLYGGGTDRLGHAVAVGDTNDDGAPDLAIGADDGSGAVWLVRGPITSGPVDDVGEALYGWSSGALGSAVALADLDGDGFDELVAGAPDEDLVAVLQGPASPAGGGQSEVDTLLLGRGDGDFGYDLDAGGDVDGDGLADVFVGARYADFSDTVWGEACVFVGVLAASEIEAEDVSCVYADHDDFNSSADAVGSGSDVDGDGHADLLVGSRASDSGSPAAALVYGPLTGTWGLSGADVHFLASYGDYAPGDAVATGADLDNDGYDDLLVGDPAQDQGGLDLGVGHLFLGGSW